MGYLQCIAHTVIDPDQAKRASIFLMGDVSSNQRANSRRIDIGNAREIKNQVGGLARPNLGLKFKEIADEDRARQTNNSLPFLRTVLFLNDEWLLWHPQILLRR